MDEHRLVFQLGIGPVEDAAFLDVLTVIRVASTCEDSAKLHKTAQLADELPILEVCVCCKSQSSDQRLMLRSDCGRSSTCRAKPGWKSIQSPFG